MAAEGFGEGDINNFHVQIKSLISIWNDFLIAQIIPVLSGLWDPGSEYNPAQHLQDLEIYPSYEAIA